MRKYMCYKKKKCLIYSSFYKMLLLEMEGDTISLEFVVVVPLFKWSMNI